MRKAAFVRLTPQPRAELTDRLEPEALNGRRRRHLQILLRADEGRTDERIAAATGASCSTVERHRTRFAREGLESALADKPRSGAGPRPSSTASRRRCSSPWPARTHPRGRREGPPSGWPTAPSRSK